MISRRRFIKTSAIGSAGLFGAFNFSGISAFGREDDADLYSLSRALLNDWTEALLKLQIKDRSRPDDFGGIICPAKKIVHGRVGDAIYPLLYLADETGNSKYTDSAGLLYEWMERRVSQPDGSWLNEPVAKSWKGTTVFFVISLCEALKNHLSVIEPGLKTRIENRLLKAGEYIYQNFSLDYGNINYPVSASYGLSLLGQLLDIKKFRDKGKDFARRSLNYFTPEGFLYGEGDIQTASKKGCYAIDLGYNIEESLPGLVMYGLLNKDEEVLETVTRSLQTHMEFMLPDGGWDNSWGTRNYKWTYWGSRTCDGCQPAYALLADRDSRFYKVAFKNTLLLRQSTENGILSGGPHYSSHGVPPSIHHTFCHMKALASILDHKPSIKTLRNEKTALPREQIYGSRFFRDIQTCLISKGSFRATVTAYDKEYKKTKNGHASGGALSMLWHEKTGAILAASMNEYQLIEADNMQPPVAPSTCLTPRVELRIGDATYMNISDLSAELSVEEQGGRSIVRTESRLVDRDQQNPPLGEVRCHITYTFTDGLVTLGFRIEDSPYRDSISTIIPVISKAEETIENSANSFSINKGATVLKISSDKNLGLMSIDGKRVFNHVPGLQAIPFLIKNNESEVEIEVLELS